MFERERESVRLVFQPEHAHSGPWKETKGSQGQARLENEGRVIDQTLPGCSCGGEGEQKGGTLLLLLPVVVVVVVGVVGVGVVEIELQHRHVHAVELCVHRNALCALRTTRRESLWRPVGECVGVGRGEGRGRWRQIFTSRNHNRAAAGGRAVSGRNPINRVHTNDPGGRHHRATQPSGRFGKTKQKSKTEVCMLGWGRGWGGGEEGFGKRKRKKAQSRQAHIISNDHHPAIDSSLRNKFSLAHLNNAGDE